MYVKCQNEKKPNKQTNKQSCGHICTQDGKCQNATVKKLVLLIWQLHDQQKQQQHREQKHDTNKTCKKRECMQDHAMCTPKRINGGF